MKRAMRAKRCSYEIDIGEQFESVKSEIGAIGTKFQSLETKLDKFISSFEGRLDALNKNMETVLKTITAHEARITALEQANSEQKVRRDTTEELIKKAYSFGKGVLYVGLAFAALGGFKWAGTLLGLFGN